MFHSFPHTYQYSQTHGWTETYTHQYPQTSIHSEINWKAQSKPGHSECSWECEHYFTVSFDFQMTTLQIPSPTALDNNNQVNPFPFIIFKEIGRSH